MKIVEHVCLLIILTGLCALQIIHARQIKQLEKDNLALYTLVIAASPALQQLVADLKSTHTIKDDSVRQLIQSRKVDNFFHDRATEQQASSEVSRF